MKISLDDSSGFFGPPAKAVLGIKRIIFKAREQLVSKP